MQLQFTLCHSILCQLLLNSIKPRVLPINHTNIITTLSPMKSRYPNHTHSKYYLTKPFSLPKLHSSKTPSHPHSYSVHQLSSVCQIFQTAAPVVVLQIQIAIRNGDFLEGGGNFHQLLFDCLDRRADLKLNRLHTTDGVVVFCQVFCYDKFQEFCSISINCVLDALSTHSRQTILGIEKLLDTDDFNTS